MNAPDVLGWILLVAGLLAVLAWVVFIVIAATQIVRSRRMAYAGKVLWIAALVAFPLAGVLCWYAFGDRTRGVVRF